MTSQARRTQIVEAAIAVIAEVGYAKASFAKIAEHAGLSSTRLISYHFSSRSELMDAVVTDVIGRIGRHVGERVALETTAAGQLSAYILAVVGFIDRDRASMIALAEVVLGAGFDDGIEADRSATDGVAAILLHGQQTGEFRRFDTRVMATTVQRSVDGLPFLLRAEPDLDCAEYAAELVTLFELATAHPARAEQ
ncbi:TetR/AcrR family transcriptional regulator [Nakamurella sp. GG22]